MRILVAGSLRFRLMVVLVAAGILALSLAQLRDAPVEVLPEFSPPYVEVQTEALGLSAEEVEEFVTVPLEGNLLNSVAGIDVIRSESVLGLSSIVMTFVPGTDILDARQLVQERLTQAHALPNVSAPPTMLQPLSAASRVLMIGLSSKNLSALELGLLARWTIKPRLLGVSGVANVGMWGHRDHQLQVQVDPARLRSHDVTLQQVIRTAGNAQLVSPLTFLEASSPGASGFIDTANQRLQVRHVLPITKPEGLAQVPLDGVPAGTLKLGDVTTMVEDHQPLIGDALVGGDAALMLVVEKFPGANTRQVTRDVESALEALKPALTGVEVDPGVFRPATYVEKSIDNLSLALLVGGILMLAVLLALLVEWRLAIVSLVSIALSLSAAAAVLVLRGETISALALAGLALAAVVVIDDVVAGADAVRRRLRERQRSSDADHTEEVLEATLETRRPLTYATLIVLLGVLPLFFLPAPADAFFEPLAVSYALAVLVSMAVALTAAAALTMTLLRRGPLVRGDGPLVPPLARAYGATLDRVAARPHVVYTAIALVAAVGIVLLPRAGVSLLPSFKESELVVQVDGAPGTSRPEMVRVTSQLARELQGLPGVRRVGAHVGRAVMADQVAGMNAGELWISIDPARDHDETVGAIREVVAGYPGLDSGVVTYADEQIRAVGAVVDGNDDRSNTGLDALMGADQPVAVRLYGNDLGVLRTEAEKVRRALVNVPGVVDPRVERRVVEPIVEIEPDLAAAARYGVKPGDVRRAAAILVQGIVVGSLFEEQKVFDVVVTGAPATRNSLSSIRALLIDTPSGGHVPLSEVARVRIVPTPTVIKREASSLRIDVVAGIDGRSLGAVLEDVEHAVAGMVFPLEYHADVLGESSDRRAAAVRIAAVAGICLLGIFLLLQAAFGSWRLAAVSLAVAPVALVGGIVAVHTAGGTISLGSALGLFALFSLVVRSALQLAEQVRRGGREPGVPDPESVLQGARDRLRPLMTTSLAVAAVFLPFAVLGDRAGFEIVRPMAIVTLGGLVTMLPFALFVLPVLYRRFGLATARAATEKVAAPVVLHPGG